jgi:methionyl-tRNA formyltransferase
MVAIDSPATWLVFGALDKAIGVDHVVIEDRIGPRAMMAARARRLGWPTVAGQAVFRIAVMPLLERLSRRRRQSIIEAAGLAETRPGEGHITRVPSVNDPATVAALRELAPHVVVVGGTRIISASVLDTVPSTFLNMHAGITPRYRGVHGGYWALASGDPEHCGVTVHVLDPGIDTGDIIAQARIQPTSEDTFVTYPSLQLVAGLPLLVDAVRAALDGRLEPSPATGPSRQWYHPTAWRYLYAWLRTGVR